MVYLVLPYFRGTTYALDILYAFIKGLIEFVQVLNRNRNLGKIKFYTKYMWLAIHSSLLIK